MTEGIAHKDKPNITINHPHHLNDFFGMMSFLHMGQIIGLALRSFQYLPDMDQLF